MISVFIRGCLLPAFSLPHLYFHKLLQEFRAFLLSGNWRRVESVTLNDFMFTVALGTPSSGHQIQALVVHL